jgi:hypothetical protein
LTNGLSDLHAHICYHIGLCETCGRQYEIPVREWVQDGIGSSS